MAMEQGPQQSVEQFKGQARLPKFAVPRRYDLSFKPDLSACTFTGAVQITVDVIDPTHFLVLNSAELIVRDGSVSFKSHYFDEELRPSDIVLVEEDEILVLKFDEVLPIGTGVLAINFEGTLSDRMRGFYRSVYEHNGEKKNMAVTQFEPADARRCFPCWDEPACKATFKITLEVPFELVALSNMPIIDEKVDGSLKTVLFEESPIMSTYLVAIVIGLFDYVEDSTTDGVKVRVYCQGGKSNQGKFALDVAVKTLDLYRKYFNEPYPLPKLDMVAIPDFAAGAMENYGLVTYREMALLYDELHSAAANKQRVATVVAHELAHQWFGNLVTMEWWTHLWLNEGFATWVSYLSADSLFPEWKIWTQFLDETTAGLRLDALAESHPIEVDINHANEIDEIFDAISYRKGASVIRMLQSYLGADVFQKSLALYIKRFAWSNAKTEDLWAALEEVSGEPVNLIMNSWTKQKGYPVVSVKVNGDSLEFEQSQFLSSGLPGDGQWMVPVTICFGSYHAQKKFLLKTKTEKLDKLDLSESLDTGTNLVQQGSQRKGGTQTWVKVNVDQTGFYRVQYDDQLTAGLRYAIEAKQLSEIDRYGILDDSFALCMACKQTTSSLISLMSAYREELNYTVVSQIISMNYKLADMIAEATPELLNETKLFLINLLQFSAEKLGWDPKEGESHLDAMLRGEILTALAGLGHESTLHEAGRRFSAFLDDRNTPLLPPDIRKAAFIAVMQTVTATNRSGYDSLLRIYKETDLSQEKVRILGCLSSCPDAAVVLDVLNFLLTPAVRNQDVVYGLARVSREGRETAWIWLKENWDFISKTWGSGFLITHFVSSIVSPFSSDEKAKEIEAFFATRIKPSISRTVKQSLERVGNNVRWVHHIKNDKGLGEVVRELAYRKY